MTSWACAPRPGAHRAAPTPAAARLRVGAVVLVGALLALVGATVVLPTLDASPAGAQAPAAPQAATTSTASGRSVVFSYSADVPPNDVYASPRALSPLPVFRALAHHVDLEAAYSGPPAHLGLMVRLSSSTGWSGAVPLAREVAVQGRGRVRATVDLRRLEERGALVAAQTQMPFEGLTVEVVATVRDAAGTWAPSVLLQLTPLQLRLAGEPSTLVVAQEGSTSVGALPPAPTPRSRLGDLLAWRPDGLLTAVALTLLVAAAGVLARRRLDEDAAGRARRRLGRLLLDVAPVDLSGMRVLDVASPDALARLAERYGLLVLHWTDASGAVFLVHDETSAYRWTTERDEAALPLALVPAPRVAPGAGPSADREQTGAAGRATSR